MVDAACTTDKRIRKSRYASPMRELGGTCEAIGGFQITAYDKEPSQMHRVSCQCNENGQEYGVIHGSYWHPRPYPGDDHLRTVVCR